MRTGALDAVIKNYAVICTELEQIGRGYYGEPSRKVSGLLALMEKFTTFFGLKLSHLVFSATEQLSRTLQSSNVQEATMAASAAARFLHRQRLESSFEYFYHLTVEEAKDLTQPSTIPRQRRIPVILDSGAPKHQFLTSEDYFQKQYFEVLDLLASELGHRFDQESFQALREVEKLLIESCNGIPVKPSVNFQKMYMPVTSSLTI